MSITHTPSGPEAHKIPTTNPIPPPSPEEPAMSLNDAVKTIQDTFTNIRSREKTSEEITAPTEFTDIHTALFGLKRITPDVFDTLAELISETSTEKPFENLSTDGMTLVGQYLQWCFENEISEPFTYIKLAFPYGNTLTEIASGIDSNDKLIPPEITDMQQIFDEEKQKTLDKIKALGFNPDTIHYYSLIESLYELSKTDPAKETELTAIVAELTEKCPKAQEMTKKGINLATLHLYTKARDLQEKIENNPVKDELIALEQELLAHCSHARKLYREQVASEERANAAIKQAIFKNLHNMSWNSLKSTMEHY